MQHTVRLLLAVALSALIHLSLIYGFTLKLSAGGASVGHVLHARLQPGDPPTLPDSQEASLEAESQVVASTEMEPPSPVPAHESPARAPAESASAPAGAPLPPVPLLADTSVYPSRDLDVFPKPLTAIKAPFPPRASDDQISGAVTLELIIDEHGAVGDVKVVEANPEGYFEDAAVETFKAARFSPAQKDGKPVRCRLAIKVDFDLDPNASESVARAIR